MTALLRQRTTVRPSVPERPLRAGKNGPRADSADLEILRRAAVRMALSRRAAR
ncbi:MAG: hypothetical protein U0636_05995 [Phycisphaerales bacterium]